MFRNGEQPQCADPTKVVISFTDKGLGHNAAPDGWIPVSERMPEVGSTVMVFMDKPSQSSTDYAIATFDKYGFSRAKVTHWQPLPDAPKGV